MFRKLARIHQGQRGITGLETAIILIAFVVVAAVFAYTALSAGLFATQKSQEAVYSGLKEARSTLEIKGDVTATANATGPAGNIKQISFTVASVLGGEKIDFTHPNAATDNTGKPLAGSNNKVVISYIDQYQQVENLYWFITPLGADNNDDILDNGEKFQVTIGGPSNISGAGNLLNALNPYLSVNKTFTISVKTAAGAVLNIERTTPANIDTVMNLH